MAFARPFGTPTAEVGASKWQSVGSCRGRQNCVIYSVCYFVSSGNERPARPAGAVERRAEVRAAASPGVRGPNGRGVAAERRPGVHDAATARARRARRVGGRRRRGPAARLSDHDRGRGGAGDVVAHAAGHDVAAARRAGHQGLGRAAAARCRRARRGAGAPAVRRGAHAAVDASEGRRRRARGRVLVGRRCGAVPARLGDSMAGRRRRPPRAAADPPPPPGPQLAPRLRRRSGVRR